MTPIIGAPAPRGTPLGVMFSALRKHSESWEDGMHLPWPSECLWGRQQVWAAWLGGHGWCHHSLRYVTWGISAP